jgi:hypothetical protein
LGTPTAVGPIQIFVTLALAAAVTASAEEPTRIYVYARRDTAARSWVSISYDNSVVAEVRQGIFFAIDAEPGKHALSAEGAVPLPFDLAAGKEMFIRLDWSYWIGRSPIALFSQVNPADAQREMKYLSYVGVKRLHSNLVPKTDPRKEVPPQLSSLPSKTGAAQLIAALQSVGADEMEREALKKGLHRVIVANTRGNYYSDKWAAIDGNVLTLDHEPITNIQDVRGRTARLISVLEAAC